MTLPNIIPELYGKLLNSQASWCRVERS